MRSPVLKTVVAGCLMASGVVGCGPETVALIAVAGGTAAAIAPVVAVIGGVATTVWVLKTIENVSLDTEKKKLEIQGIHDGRREVHEVDLSDEQVQQIQRTGRVRLGDNVYRVH